MAKKNNSDEVKYLNKIFLGKELPGGTLGFQPEHYQGFKYLKKILLFFKDRIENDEKKNSVKFSDLKLELFRGYEENISDLAFIQLRILKNTNFAQKIDNREFEIGEFGLFLLNKYIKESYEVMLLGAYMLFSVIPLCIYDLQNLINQELNAKNLERTELYSRVNETKQTLLLNLLGIYSSKASYTYKTIPLYELVKKDEKAKENKIIKSKRISFKKQAGIISLDYVIGKIIKYIKDLKHLTDDDYITLEDLYFYLVRPELLDPFLSNYKFQTYRDFKYPYSSMFYFLRSNNLLENDNTDLFYEIFYAVQDKNQKSITLDELYDPVLYKNLKMKELGKKLYWHKTE